MTGGGLNLRPRDMAKFGQLYVRQFIHPRTGRIITVSVHTKKEVGTEAGL